MKRRWTMAFVAAAALIATSVAAEGASSKPEKAPVPTVVMATDWRGMPVQDAAFEAVFADGSTARVATDAGGEATVAVAKDDDEIAIRLRDDRFVSAQREQDSVPGRRLQAWTLFRRDAAAMEEDERAEFARVWPRVTVRNPWVADASDLERALRMVDGLREEEDEGVQPDDPAWAGRERLRARAVDGLGRPVAAALARLFVLDAATGKARALAVARTDPSGTAEFGGLKAGLLCRIELSDRDAFGRSALLKTGRDASTATIAMRPRGETASGFVFDGDRPAPDTIVRATTAGGATLTATTDASGFFALGPVDGATTLTLVRGTERGAVRATWAMRGGAEAAIPLHLVGKRDAP